MKRKTNTSRVQVLGSRSQLEKLITEERTFKLDVFGTAR
jgi:hypothetical protein